MNLGRFNAEIIEEIFKDFDVCSITYGDAGDNPIFEPELGKTILWKESTIAGIFSDNVNLPKLKDTLINELRLSTLINYEVEILKDCIWEREWLKDFSPMKFGKRLWIYPTEHKTPKDNRIIIRLDPGLAFGTGTHATTALCLEWIDSLMLDGKTMLDFGCGSGILGIAALKLGSSSVTAFDIDPQAIIATQQNAINNQVIKKINVLENLNEINDKFDFIVANILAEPLIKFAPSIVALLKHHGMLALSGVLSEQINEVKLAFESCIEFDSSILRNQDGQTWSIVLGKKIN
tara:strand:- start:721 stop:1593 length:873 start_codon:yes stop_codon:yes gene_type:complete